MARFIVWTSLYILFAIYVLGFNEDVIGNVLTRKHPSLYVDNNQSLLFAVYHIHVKIYAILIIATFGYIFYSVMKFIYEKKYIYLVGVFFPLGLIFLIVFVNIFHIQFI